ncbi:MAG TPA: SDR family NAD(P)-dependent oxidoreductase [Edaphocola sp.]|nr:SDR family NAD(P)-dependent oxidoreductase [Edaphocola sp.]
MKVLITGATAGIGRATAGKFAREGHEIWICGRRTERLEAIAAEFAGTTQVLIDAIDVSNRAEVAAFVNKVATTWGAPDVLVNNAGKALGLGPIQDGDIDEWDTMIDTNLKGLLYITRGIAPLMKARKQGHIINLGSTAAKYVYPNGNVYCATKHAVDALSESMRIDLLAYNIKVTAIHPGMVDTEFSLVRFNGDEQRAAATYQGFEPLHAEDIANTIYYCATLPPHVCINDLIITCTRQANGIFKITDEQLANG